MKPQEPVTGFLGLRCAAMGEITDLVARLFPWLSEAELQSVAMIAEAAAARSRLDKARMARDPATATIPRPADSVSSR